MALVDATARLVVDVGAAVAQSQLFANIDADLLERDAFRMLCCCLLRPALR